MPDENNLNQFENNFKLPWKTKKNEIILEKYSFW